MKSKRNPLYCEHNEGKVGECGYNEGKVAAKNMHDAIIKVGEGFNDE